jgi:hypothetical protein
MVPPAWYPCQQILVTKIPKLGILKKFNVRVKGVTSFMNRRANQLADHVPSLWILKGRADDQGIDSLRKLLHVGELIVPSSGFVGFGFDSFIVFWCRANAYQLPPSGTPARNPTTFHRAPRWRAPRLLDVESQRRTSALNGVGREFKEPQAATRRSLGTKTTKESGACALIE